MKKISLFFCKEKLKNIQNHPVRALCRNLFGVLALAAVFQPAALKAEIVFDAPMSFGTQHSNLFAAALDIRRLNPGENVEREAKANDVHYYRLTLEAGTAIEITIGKRDIFFEMLAILPESNDFSVRENKIPLGTELARVVAGTGAALVEPLVIVAEKTGDYLIVTRFPAAGTYSFNCGAAHTATEKDRKYAAAGRILAEMRQSLERREPIWKMRAKAEERAAIYRSLGDKKSLAISLNDVGNTYSSNAEWGKADKYFRESLEIFRALNSVPNIISNLWLIGRSSNETGDYQSAIESYNEVLTLSRAANDRESEGAMLHQLGVVYHVLAEEQKARDYYEQSLVARRSITPPTVSTLNGEGVTLTNIGNLYRGVGGGEIPIDAFPPRTMSDRQKALEYYRQALDVAIKTRTLFPNTGTLEPFNLQQIGNTYKELGNYPEALNYLNQSLELYKKGSRPAGQTNVIVSIGNLYIEKGEYRKGFEYFEEALEMLRAGSYPINQIGYLNGMAKDYNRAGETQKALDLYNESLALSRAREQHNHAAAALFEIARIERDLGNFNNARNRIEESIQTVESLRARITSQDVRTTYFSTVKRYYDFYIDLLMQAHKSQPEKGFDALALQMSEKARSRSLLDLLAQARVDIKQGVDPQLLAREREVREKLAAKAYQQSRLMLGKHTKEEAEKMQAEVTGLTDDFETVQAEIKNKSPRYAALTQPASLDARQIQRLLDSGTLLLEYSLGEKKSYLWTVSNDSIASFDLPARAEIETEARRIYELLTARNQNPAGETDEQKRARVKAAEEEYPKAAARLSEKLLGQIASRIGNKRLLIVADGALNYISFAALPVPKTLENAAAAGQPLGANHEIVKLPSASTLALLREETANRKPAPKMLAVFADPIFKPDDTRAGAANRTKPANSLSPPDKLRKPSASRDFERAVADTRSGETGGLPRLPFSRREADSIFRLAPRNLSLKETDFDASKANVFNSNLEQYRILHFATHGLLNSRQPELSGIVLSLVDKAGGEIDGFVRLQDIYNLKLAAELVVLSACQTALGKDVKGEGLISLTRGFMYAGSPRVVASLWKVDDAATAELMSVFYRKMLVENLRPAAALRAAQIELMRQPRWKSPYYWAAFTIQGDWR